MKKISLYIITIFVTSLLCSCSQSDVPSLNSSAKAEITHNHSNGMQIKENPNEPMTLDPDYGNDVINKEKMDKTIDETINGMQVVQEKNAQAKISAENAYSNVKTEYFNTDNTSQNYLEKYLVEANNHIQELLEKKQNELDGENE